MDGDFRLFPEQGSSIARDTDLLYFFLVGVTLVFTFGICFFILYFVVKYRRGSKASRANPPTSYLLEITWSVIPFILTMIMFFWGAALFFNIRTPPGETIQIYVLGKQWVWKLQHSEGRREINQLHIPAGETVQLRMISEDVIHSFFIPDFRVKMDVLPNRYTTLWFKATQPGEHELFCAEYCGTGHSEMIGRIIVMEPRKYAAWLRGEDGESARVTGEELFERHRCNTCHQEGPGARGPSLEGIFGSEIPLKSGQTVIADENYLRESILQPQAKIVAGYPEIMPSYEGQLNEEDIFQLIAYIKSLTEEPTTGPETEDSTNGTEVQE